MAEFYNARFPAEYLEEIGLVDNAFCIDTSDLYVESVGLYTNHAQVRIEFEHCIVSSSNQTECPSILLNSTQFQSWQES